MSGKKGMNLGHKSYSSPSKTRVKITCLYCGKVVTKYLCGRKEVKYCSNECAHLAMPNPTKGKFGENHPKWKEEKKSIFNKVLRSLHDYKMWRSNVFKRDNYTCTDCNKKGGYLEVHHKISLKIILEENNISNIEEALLCPLLWDIDNGVTYCYDCHVKNDRYRVKKQTTRLKLVDKKER